MLLADETLILRFNGRTMVSASRSIGDADTAARAAAMIRGVVKNMIWEKETMNGEIEGLGIGWGKKELLLGARNDLYIYEIYTPQVYYSTAMLLGPVMGLRLLRCSGASLRAMLQEHLPY